MKYTQQQAKKMHNALRELGAAIVKGCPQDIADRWGNASDVLDTVEKTPVVFRMFKGECVAIFPTLAGTNDPNTCMSYQHIGQHGACYVWIGQRARLAKSYEYAALARELKGLGYNLHVIDKIAPSHHRERIESLNA